MCWGVAQRDKENQTDGVLEPRGQGKRTEKVVATNHPGRAGQMTCPPKPLNLSLMLGTHVMA